MDFIQMQEHFQFPTHLGSLLDGSYFIVEPKWEQQTDEDAILLKGVYLVKGFLQFDFRPLAQEQMSSAIFIEHFDMEDDVAYFEYALPFSMTVPNEDIKSIELRAEQFTYESIGGAVICNWQVACDMKKQEKIVTSAQEKIETSAQEKIETSAQEKIETSAQEKIETSAREKIETSVKEKLETSIVDEKAFVKQRGELEAQIPIAEEIIAISNIEQPTSLVEDELDFLEQLADAYETMNMHTKR